jgi:hypothetical protein
MISNFWNWLAGKKTYIVAFAGAIYGTGIALNLWPHNVALDVILASTGTATIRHGITSGAAETETPPAK